MSTIEITIGNTKVTLPANLDNTFEVNGVKVTISPATQQTPDEMVYSSEMCSQSTLFQQVVEGCAVEFDYIKDGECSTRNLLVSVATDTHIAGIELDGSYKNFRRDRIDTYYSVSVPD